MSKESKPRDRWRQVYASAADRKGFCPEQWLPIGHLDGMYSVSDQGRVRSEPRTAPMSDGRIYTVRGRILAIQPPGRRHASVTIRKPGSKKQRIYPVHHLVAEAFIGPRPDGMFVLHRDDDKDNNRAVNLYYGTKSQNSTDAVNNGIHVMANRTHCPQKHPYDEVNTRHYRGGRYCRECIRQANRRIAQRNRKALGT